MSTPVRLLYVSHSFPPADRPMANVGGMQRVATELHAALMGHPQTAVESVVLRTSWKWTHVKTLPFLVKAYRRILQKARADAVDAVLFSSMVTASIAPTLRGPLSDREIPMAAIVHGRDVTLPFWPYQRLLVPRIFTALDAVLPVSRATGRAAKERGLDPAKVHVVPNGVDTGRFAPPEDHRATRRELTEAAGAALPDETLLLCSVGRQVERKGFAWFIDSVMPLLPENVHYWLAGDGPEAEAIDEAILRNDLQRRVRRLGRVPESLLKKLYRGADLFIMPNIPVDGDMEGFGVVMLEAGQAGLPTVAARLEGIQDVITEGENGHLVSSHDAGAFRDAITRYHYDREALAAAARRAAEHTDARFSWAAVADRYVEVIRSLARQPDEEVLI